MSFYEIIKIPMRTKVDIGATNIFDAVKAGEIFYYDPDSIFSREFFDLGYLENIPKEKCIFLANDKIVNTISGTYNFGEEIDVSNFTEKQLWELCLIGRFKKIYKKEIKEKESKTKVQAKKTKEIKKNSYSKIAKELNLTPKKFKNLYLEKFNKEIKDMKHTVSKPTEKKIIEALSK